MPLPMAEGLVGKKLVLYGASAGGQRAFGALKKRNSITCFSDGDKKKWGSEFCGLPVVAPESLISQVWDYVVITSMYREEIEQTLKSVGIPLERIVTVSTALLENERVDVESEWSLPSSDFSPVVVNALAEDADKFGNLRFAIEAYIHTLQQEDNRKSIWALQLLWALLMETGQETEARMAAERAIEVCDRTAYWFARLCEGPVGPVPKEISLLIGRPSLALIERLQREPVLALGIASAAELEPRLSPAFVCMDPNLSQRKNISTTAVLDAWAKTSDGGARTVVAIDERRGAHDWPDLHWVPGHIADSPLSGIVTFLVKDGYSKINVYGDIGINLLTNGLSLKHLYGKRNANVWNREALATARLVQDCEVMGVEVSVDNAVLDNTPPRRKKSGMASGELYGNV